MDIVDFAYLNWQDIRVFYIYTSIIFFSDSVDVRVQLGILLQNNRNQSQQNASFYQCIKTPDEQKAL